MNSVWRDFDCLKSAYTKAINVKCHYTESTVFMAEICIDIAWRDS